jgi:RNA-splicing ligase RtcB
MLSFNIGPELKMSLEELNHKIRVRIPFGSEVQEDAAIHMKNAFPWHAANVMAEKFSLAYFKEFGTKYDPPYYDIGWFEKKVNSIGGDMRRMINSIGSAGGGNHFIELGKATNGDHWITIHSGSRNFGKRICEFWQNKAYKSLRTDKKKIMDEQIAQIRKDFSGEEVGKKIYDLKKSMGMDYGINMTGLEWLEGSDAAGYLFDMIFAQMYAQVNRQTMLEIICADCLKVSLTEQIETVHNFIDFRDFIVRKGAVRSYAGERFILPFNMRDGLLICEGKSNVEWNYSAPHGAGRVLARGKAKRTLSMDKFQADMAGIYSTSVDRSTLDESPDAYKDSKLIEDAIQPTAVILDRVKPILNLKDTSEVRDDS